MFRKTSPQMSMLESQYLLPDAKRQRLEGSWAHPFRTVVLPLIDEELFRESFHDSNGRPNKSIRLLTGLHILKEMNDLTDTEVIDALEFNLQFHYALAVEPRTAHVCQKTLHNHRVRLLESDRARQVFEAVTRGLAEVDGLSLGRQRLDSTHVMSNIAVLTRLGLFVETVTHFLRA
ncbi:MAG: transposase, partial [bacterium]|nr:transposase [bacterium]